MGIRTKNLQNTELQLVDPGVVAAANDQAAVRVPFDGYISNIVARCATYGTGSTSSTVADVHKNGTTIFGSATKVTLSSEGAVTYSTMSATPTPVSAGDILTLDVDSVAIGSPTDLVVSVVISKTEVNEPSNETDLDAVM
jgi:hypothetical protein